MKLTTVQDVIDRGRACEKENVVLREEIEALESETAQMTLDLANANLENDHLKKLLEANGIAF